MVQTSVELLYDSSIQTLLSKWCFEFLLGLLSPIPLTPASAEGFLLLTRSQPPLHPPSRSPLSSIPLTSDRTSLAQTVLALKGYCGFL